MTAATPADSSIRFREMLERASTDGWDVAVALGALERSGASLGPKLKARAEDRLARSPVGAEALAVALGRLEWRLGRLEAALEGQLDGYDPRVAESLLAAARQRDEISLGWGKVEGGDAERLETCDRRLRDSLDRTYGVSVALGSLPLGVAAADPAHWWWTAKRGCDDERLERALSNELAPDEHAWLQRHFRSCQPCRQSHSAHTALIAALKSLPEETCPIASQVDPVAEKCLRDHVSVCEDCLRPLEGCQQNRDAFGPFSSYEEAGPLELLSSLALERLEEEVEFGTYDSAGRRGFIVSSSSDVECAALVFPSRTVALEGGQGHFWTTSPLPQDSAPTLLVHQRGKEDLRVTERPLPPLSSLPPALDPAEVAFLSTALALGNRILVVERLAARLKRTPSRLLRGALQETLGHVKAQDRAGGPARRGVARALVSWRGYGGVVEVRACLAASDNWKYFLSKDGAGPFLNALAKGAEAGIALVLNREPSDDPKPARVVANVTDPHLEASPASASAGLAAALAVVSRELGQPLPSRLACSGAVSAEGRVRGGRRDALREELEWVVREEPGALIVLAEEDRRQVPESVLEAHEVHFVADLAQAVQLLFPTGERPEIADAARRMDRAEELFFDYPRRSEALSQVEGILDDAKLPQELRFRAAWVEAACAASQGKPARVLEVYDQASALGDELLAAGRIDPAEVVYLRLGRADALGDRFEFVRSFQTLEDARSISQPRSELSAKVDGLHGLMLTYSGRAEEAIPLLERSRLTASDPDRPKFGCWLGLALTEGGEFDAALRVLSSSLRDCEELQGHPARTSNEIFLQRALGRLHLRRGDSSAAEECARAGLGMLERPSVYPRCSLLQILGEAALLQPGGFPRGLDLLKEASEGAPGLPPLLLLVLALPQLALARALYMSDSTSSEAREVFRAARLRIGAFAPAANRFQKELDDLVLEPRVAFMAATRILRTLPY